MTGPQLDLFGSGPALPTGFAYQVELISTAEEQDLLQQIAELPFREFAFHGYVGRRRIVSFGWEYDFEKERVHRIADMPAFLHSLR